MADMRSPFVPAPEDAARYSAAVAAAWEARDKAETESARLPTQKQRVAARQLALAVYEKAVAEAKRGAL